MTEDSTRTLERPREAIYHLAECLVLSFEYVESDRCFRFVSDYPEKLPASDRAFAAFVFEGVTDFVRKSGDLNRFSRFRYTYSAADDETPVVVQSVRTIECAPKSVTQFWFGPNFGGLNFAYTAVSAFVRDARARQVGNSFVYTDVASGEDFDFFSPLANIIRKIDGRIA